MQRNTVLPSLMRTPIPIRDGGAVLGASIEHSKWLSGVAWTIQVIALIDFPDTLAQTSSAVLVTVSGAVVGDGVLVGPYPDAIIANSFYTAEVTDKDEVTVRFHNYSALSIDPPEAQFSLYVFKR